MPRMASGAAGPKVTPPQRPPFLLLQFSTAVPTDFLISTEAITAAERRIELIE
jgi:hypothetical protein